MSTYKFLISKNNIAAATDEHITYDDTNGGEDVDVTLWVNDEEIHTVTLPDAGACLQYTGTLSEGYHTVKIQPEAGKPTDIRIDQVLIDDNIVVGSQYKIDTRIFGKAFDYFKYECCAPFRSPKHTDHVWWGEVYSSDYTKKSNTTYYRPHVVTDVGEWWQWSFSVNSAGQLHWTVDESDSLLWDSTDNFCYYAGKSLLNDSATYPVCDSEAVAQWITDQHVNLQVDAPSWQGAGVYDSALVYVNDSTVSWDLGVESETLTTLYTQQEYHDAVWYNMLWWPVNNIEPIIVS